LEAGLAKVYSIEGVVPVIDPTAFVHPTAVLIGDVIIGPRCYVGPLACLRGDFGRLIMEEGANLQDTCVVHGFPGSDTVIEVGMNAVVMDNAVIGEASIVAAMSFVKAGMVVPPRSMVMGTPAKVTRTLSDDEIAWKHRGTVEYQQLAIRCMQSMHEVEPLTQVEADRKRLRLDDPNNLLKPKTSNSS
jgi:phenylacetic acid degradation protein